MLLASWLARSCCLCCFSRHLRAGSALLNPPPQVRPFSMNPCVNDDARFAPASKGMSHELKLSTALALVRSRKRSYQSSAPMKQQLQQQWRPKVKAQCTTSIETESLTSPSSPWDQLATVVGNLNDETRKVDKVSSSLKVDEKLIEAINRKRKKMKKKIETDTKTSLSVSIVKAGRFIEITGSSQDDVDMAMTKLQALMRKDEAAAEAPKEKPVLSKGNATMQWKPKAGVHTSAGAVEASEEELISGTVEIDTKLLRLVKGKKNEVKKRIEEETNTTLHIGSPLVVKGTSEESVQKALAEIQKVLEEAINDTKFQYSHFISLPLSVHPALVKELEDFQVSVLTTLGIPLMDEPQAANEESLDEELEVVDAKTSSDEKTDAENQDTEASDEQTIASSLGLEVADAKVSSDVKTNAGNQDELATIEEKVFDAVYKQSVASSLDLELGKNELETLSSRTDVEIEAAVFNAEVKYAEADHTEVQQKFIRAQVSPEVEKTTRANTGVKGDAQNTTPDFLLDLNSAAEPKYEPIAEVPMAPKKESKSGVEKSIFIKPSRFHLTVLMLKLWNDERVKLASDVLQKCLPDVAAALKGNPVSVSLQGLEIMRGSPKNTRVLYAKVAEAGEGSRLLQACQVLIDAFIESGLVLSKDKDQALKLHATVMNTSHRRSKSKFKNKGFDATAIIEKYGEAKWGEYQILEAHLSQRFKYDENGYYHCCSSIPFTGVAKADIEAEKVETEAVE